ncbi:unnamed protein product [Owenia fusiformis]|uniref:Uncharacterized protein n=1 Tax=Owenia fusiformis TaxID=6347 RepID=A0A8J1XLJ0_OWEFU|nr:unnamed protein product [Owenia fusiformis]
MLEHLKKTMAKFQEFHQEIEIARFNRSRYLDRSETKREHSSSSFLNYIMLLLPLEIISQRRYSKKSTISHKYKYILELRSFLTFCNNHPHNEATTGLTNALVFNVSFDNTCSWPYKLLSIYFAEKGTRDASDQSTSVTKQR